MRYVLLGDRQGFTLWDLFSKHPAGARFGTSRDMNRKEVVFGFERAGQSVLTAPEKGQMLAWEIPSHWEDDPERIRQQMSVDTGQEFDEVWGFHFLLKPGEWAERRESLHTSSSVPGMLC
jgi:hypothetical protein